METQINKKKLSISKMPPKKKDVHAACDARDQTNKLTISSLRTEILALKQQIVQLDRKLKDQQQQMQQSYMQKNGLLALLDKYRRIKDNRERSSAPLPSGVILGRPSHLREFFEKRDSLVAHGFFVPHSEFGHAKAVPSFSAAAEEELQELTQVHSVWLQVQERFQQLTEAKKRYLDYEAAKQDPEHQVKWKSLVTKAAVATPHVGHKRSRDEDKKQEEEEDDEHEGCLE
jgi:hypothetical protein